MSKKISTNIDQAGDGAQNTMAEQIRAARAQKGLSQRALSARTGIMQSHISKIENGGSDIRMSSLLTIARALDLELMLVPRSVYATTQQLLRNQSEGNELPQTPAYQLDKEDDHE